MQFFVTTQGIARAARDAPDVLELLLPEARDLAPYLHRLAELAEGEVHARVALADVRLLPPIARPGCFVIAGLNYRAHCAEIGRPVPDRLLFGFAPGSAAHGAGAPVLLPPAAPGEVDYEGEIAIVIGRRAERVSAAEAWDVVAGLAPLNDVSARDVQAAGTREAVGQAKGFATFKPFGPCLATLEAFADRNDIGIRTWVNGELRQAGRSSDMVFSLPAIVEAVTAVRTLEPGDVICTGTPGGVAHGGAYPYLVAGDVVEIEVEGLPRLTSPFAEA